jgi:hypothetical protein
MSSNSQLRSSTGIFINGTRQDVEAIRNELVPNNELKLKEISKRLVRIGLFATGDKELGVLKSDHYSVQ